MLGRAIVVGVHVERTTITELDATPRADEFVLDCSGRSGVIARRTGLRQFDDGLRTIALVGFDGGLLHREATCSILVLVDSTPQTEAIHLVIEHLLMHLLKEDLLTLSPP